VFVRDAAGQNVIALIAEAAIQANLEPTLIRLIDEMDADPPSAPLNLVATPGNGKITLTWSAPSSNGGSTITGYKVYRGTSSGSLSILTTLGNVLTYTNTGLTNGQTYHYKVSAVNSAGEGLQSSEVSSTPVTVPTAPQSFSATAGNTQIVLSWSPPANDGGAVITGYKVYRGTSSGGETLLTTLGNFLNFNNTGLTNGVTYYYKVSAVNAIGEGPQSSEVLVKPVGPPSAPYLTSGKAGNGHVVLAWTVPDNNGGSAITGYKVYRGTTTNGETLIAELGNVLTYNSTGLTNGVTYFHKVSAVNSIGESSLSNELNATPALVPLPPTLDSATPGNAQVVLNWRAPTDDGGAPIIQYKVYRGTSTGGEVWLITLGSVLNYTNTGLANGVTYYYKVSAVNAIGEGPQSSEVSATPVTVPTAPLNLAALGSVERIVLSWQIPENDGGSAITGYMVFRATTSGGQDAVLIAITNATTRTYADTEIVPNVHYFYIVKALNQVGESDPSNEDSTFSVAAQVPSPPTDLNARACDGFVILTWNASTSVGSSSIIGYQVYRGASSDAVTLNIVSTDAGTLTYKDSAVTNGETYLYAVKAINGEGASSFSGMVSATPTEPSAPTAPQNLTAAGYDGYVLVTWEAPFASGTSPITGYDVYRSNDSISEGSIIGQVPAATMTYNDSTVTNYVTYYYTLKAVNLVGASPASNMAQATPSVEGIAPGAPTGLDATGHEGSVLLTWNAPSNAGSGIVDYLIFRASISGGQGAPLATVPGSVLSYEDIAVEIGVIYYYTVKASNFHGTSAVSNEGSASATEVPPGTPTVPQDFEAMPGHGMVNLTWAAPVNPGISPITGYNIYRGDVPGTLSLLANVTGTSYTDTGVEPGQTYYYQVLAVSVAGEGAPTTEIMVALSANLPSPPRNLTTVVGVGKITLTWQAPFDDGGSSITGYKVYRQGAEGNFNLMDTLGADSTSYVDATGTVGTTYTYYVVAINVNGQGQDSAHVTATPQGEAEDPTENSLLYLGAVVAGIAIIAVMAFFLTRRSR
jgi:titin